MANASKQRKRRNLALGLAFLAPNIVGFLTFTLFPLLFSLALAFTNWDLRQHNMFKEVSLKFIGFENFTRLLAEADFWRFLGNTLFFMMGIPFGIAGSLVAAILLTQEMRGGTRRNWGILFAAAGLICGLGALILVQAAATAMTILICSVVGLILILGAAGGTAIYRTLFYMPCFTAGVATYILWKKLYNPHTGPINAALRPIVDRVAAAVQTLPAPLLQNAHWPTTILMALAVLYGVWRLRANWRDGEMGWFALLAGALFLAAPIPLAQRWFPAQSAGWFYTLFAAATILVFLATTFGRPRRFTCPAQEGLGHAILLCAILMVAEWMLLGAGNVLHRLPRMAADGLDPPTWLASYHWAKPAIMLMGFWAAIGSNNMLLYLAGLSNIPQELTEASAIDGASAWQRFYHVTWPQLAPVTFFIIIMSVIGGLQGGFEMARTMTQGGPAGSTMTLSYYVYSQGFDTLRIAYASGIAWTLFALVFLCTIFNWKFGNRYVND